MTKTPAMPRRCSGEGPFRIAGAALLLVLFGVLPSGGIDYEPSSLARMLGLADLVVYGTVERVEGETITVTVHESLAGEPPPTQIEVVRYALYSQGGGLAAYEPGQSFVWLLAWRAEAGIVGAPERWHVLGAEGEGELPAEADCVFLPQGTVAGLPDEERELHGRRRRVQHLGRRGFWTAAEEYLRCVRWRPATSVAPAQPVQICTDQEMADFAGRSVLHRHLAKRSSDRP